MTSGSILSLALFVAGAGLLLPVTSSAAGGEADKGGISLNQTRVIVDAKGNIKNLTITNTSDRTFLVQSRVAQTLDGAHAVPFIVTPPLFRLVPHSSQILRILPQGISSLPVDRESLFSLSVLTIPAGENQNDSQLRMSAGMRFGLKLFYRPKGLDAPTESQTCALRFTQSAQNVRIENPTAYHQTLGTLILNGAPADLQTHPLMLPPYGVLTYPTKVNLEHIRWQAINDYGALSTACQRSLNQKQEAL
jgi:fimbrial chaperone protein